MADKKDAPTAGHNLKIDEERFIKLCEEYADCDAQSKELNARRKEIRDTVSEQMGEDSKAFQHVYQYFKQNRHQRDGYDESYQRMWDALNKADTGALFSFMAKDVPVADNTRAAA